MNHEKILLQSTTKSFVMGLLGFEMVSIKMASTQPLSDYDNYLPVCAMGEVQGGHQVHKSSSTKAVVEEGRQGAPSVCKRLVKTTYRLTLKATTCFQGVRLLLQPRKNHRFLNAICLQKAKLYVLALLSASKEKQQKLNPPSRRILHPNGAEEASSISSPRTNHKGKHKNSFWYYQEPKEKAHPKPEGAGRQEASAPLYIYTHSLYILCSNALQTGLGPTALFPSMGLY